MFETNKSSVKVGDNGLASKLSYPQLTGYGLLIFRVILVLIAVLAYEPWQVWIALQLAILPEFVNDLRHGPAKAAVIRHSTMLIASVLLGTGFWMSLNSSDAGLHQIGVVLLLVGIGGALGWFPIPRGNMTMGIRPEATDQKFFGLIGDSFAPILIASMFLLRCVQAGHWGEADLALLAVVSLFSLSFSGIRLSGHLSTIQRCRISILTILSNANLATVLMGWERLYPERDWNTTSNLLSGETLFAAVLIIESAAIIILLVGFSIRSRDTSPADDHPNYTRWRGYFCSFASLSLAGVPPLPGAWWRFTILSSFLLPHQRSIVTNLTEPHFGMIAIAIAYFTGLLLVMLGQLTYIPLGQAADEVQNQTALPPGDREPSQPPIVTSVTGKVR